MADSDIITRLDTPSLSRMLDELPDIVVVLDASARLIWANHRAEQFFERPRDASIGLSALDFVHPDDLELVLCSLETIQSKEIGGRLGPSLRAAAELLSAKRRLMAEEAAQKSSVKMLLPLVLLILPAMMIIILGPAIIQIFQMLMGATA